jgi:hypothetical protein
VPVVVVGEVPDMVEGDVVGIAEMLAVKEGPLVIEPVKERQII